jgi:hypothetical protein
LTNVNTAIWTPQGPYNQIPSGAISFSGSSQYLTTPSNAWTTLAGTFTVEFYVNFKATPTANPFIGVNAAGGFNIYNDGTRITPNVFGSGNIFNSTFLVSNIVLGAWYHIAVTRNSSNLMTMWVNGVSVGSTTTATTYTQGIWQIGNTNFNCYISNFRATNTTVYTTNFIPPNTALTAISGTSLLLAVLNTNDFIADSSANNFTVTNVGTATWSGYGPFNS